MKSMISNRLVHLVILVHRYVGIPMAIVFIVWFVSGIVMIYTGGMPAESIAEKRGRLAPIDSSKILLSADDAARMSQVRPVAATIEQLLDRPVYRFRDDMPSEFIIFADNGEPFDGVSPEFGVRIVQETEGIDASSIEFIRTLSTPDQWTITEQRHLPMHLYRTTDGSDIAIYVAAATGEIALTVTPTDRMLAWAGAIPHWFYVTPLRTNQPAWFWTVVFVAAIGCLVALLGIILTFTQFHRSRPFSLTASVRYRGVMKWHYYSGAIFGLIILTWVFSGMLSMQPFSWMNRAQIVVGREALAGGPLNLSDFSENLANDNAPPGTQVAYSRIDLLRIDGSPVLRIFPAGDPMAPILVDAHTQDVRSALIDKEAVVKNVESATGYSVTEIALLEDYDAYYYTRDHTLPLPVFRLQLGDPDQSRLYVDALTGELARQDHRYSRLERWLFNGLHSLDFPIWYFSRPLWDVVLIILSIGGLVSSVLGLALGYRRITGRTRAHS